MKRFGPFWRILVALLLIFALAPVVVLSGPVLAAATTTITYIPQYVNSLTSITGTAVADGNVTAVEIQIKRDSDDQYWNGVTEEWVTSSATWNDAEPTDGAFNSDDEDWEISTTTPDELPTWIDGYTYYIYARAYDDAVVGATDTESFTYDITDPVNVIDDILDYVNSLTEITGTATDTNGKVAGVELLIQRDSDDKYWNNTTWVVSETWIDTTASDGVFNSDDEDWEITTQTTLELPTWADGETYDIEARAEDVATNVDSTPATESFTYDTTKPNTTITDIPASVPSLTEVTGTANDTSPGKVAGVEVLIQRDSDDKYWDGTNWVVSETWIDATASDNAFDSASEDWEITATTSPASPTIWGGGETYDIKARAKDAAENEDPSPATVDVTIVRGLSWWHYLLIALGGIILIGGLTLLFMRRRLKRPSPEEVQPEEFEF